MNKKHICIFKLESNISLLWEDVSFYPSIHPNLLPFSRYNCFTQICHWLASARGFFYIFFYRFFLYHVTVGHNNLVAQTTYGLLFYRSTVSKTRLINNHMPHQNLISFSSAYGHIAFYWTVSCSCEQSCWITDKQMQIKRISLLKVIRLFLTIK